MGRGLWFNQLGKFGEQVLSALNTRKFSNFYDQIKEQRQQPRMHHGAISFFSGNFEKKTDQNSSSTGTYSPAWKFI